MWPRCTSKPRNSTGAVTGDVSGTRRSRFCAQAPRNGLNHAEAWAIAADEKRLLNVAPKPASAIPGVTALPAGTSILARSAAFTVARVLDALAIGTLGIVAVIVALTFGDFGLGWDDY